MLKWFRKLWTGDDGKQYAVIVEPSPFRVAESSLNGPYTKRQARMFALRYVVANPFGEARLYAADKSAKWPPKLNRIIE